MSSKCKATSTPSDSDSRPPRTRKLDGSSTELRRSLTPPGYRRLPPSLRDPYLERFRLINGEGFDLLRRIGGLKVKARGGLMFDDTEETTIQGGLGNDPETFAPPRPCRRVPTAPKGFYRNDYGGIGRRHAEPDQAVFWSRGRDRRRYVVGIDEDGYLIDDPDDPDPPPEGRGTYEDYSPGYGDPPQRPIGFPDWRFEVNCQSVTKSKKAQCKKSRTGKSRFCYLHTIDDSGIEPDWPEYEGPDYQGDRTWGIGGFWRN